VIDDGERLLRRANLAARGAQSFERLRRSHLVDKMAVDVEQTGAVGLLVNQMIVPDLVVQGRRFGHFCCPDRCFGALWAACNRRAFYSLNFRGKVS
jgi:hypothetical protein